MSLVRHPHAHTDTHPAEGTTSQVTASALPPDAEQVDDGQWWHCVL